VRPLLADRGNRLEAPEAGDRAGRLVPGPVRGIAMQVAVAVQAVQVRRPGPLSG
jgi:hypothetical protein